MYKHISENLYTVAQYSRHTVSKIGVPLVENYVLRIKDQKI